jgi:hypothetical protein
MMNAGIIAGAGARRGAFSAAIVEAIAGALDLDSVGIVYDALVDDPASGIDTIGVRVGEILEEAAAAGTTLNAGTASTVYVVEESLAADVTTASGPTAYNESMLEAAVAAATVQSLVTATVTAVVAGPEPASVSSSGPSSRTLKSGTTVAIT